MDKNKILKKKFNIFIIKITVNIVDLQFMLHNLFTLTI